MDKAIHNLFPFVDFLYILQLEEYSPSDYFKWIISRLLKRGFQKSGRIVWTSKAKVLFALSLVLYMSLMLIFTYLIPNVLWLILTIVVISFLIPIIVGLASIIILPLDAAIKQGEMTKAIHKLQSLPKCTVVAIAGSYGKSSTRSFAYQILKNYFHVHTPPENHNTPLSISRDIIKNLSVRDEIYLVELGEYRPGDLKQFAELLNPEVVVLTGVGPQHLHTFGSQNVVEEEFSQFLNLTDTKTQIVNFDNPSAVKAVGDNRVTRYKTADLSSFHSNNPLLKVTPINQNIAGAVAIAKHFDVSDSQIDKSLDTLKTLERRLDTMMAGSITIIDDTYNINPESACAALAHLDTYDRRKILVTGGIVDQGDNEKEANIQYGKDLSTVANIVVLANNNLAKFIEQGISTSHPKPQIVLSDRPEMTPRILEHILKKNDVVLLQNELPDTYWS